MFYSFILFAEASTLVLPVTGIYTIILALLIFALTGNVIKYRRSQKIGIGDGGNNDLNVAIRAHGNAIEQIPMCLILLAVAEINGANAIVLHSFGGLLVVARILHPMGLIASKGGVNFGRFFGTVFTFLVILGLCVVNFMQIFLG